MKLLVVDDDSALRALVTSLFSHEGFDVMSAEDGDKALRLMASNHFDCVITDIFMPNKDGYELIRDIVKRGNGTKIVALTGMPETAEFGKDCLKIASMLGAHNVIRKPFDFPELLQVVKDIEAI